MKVSDVAKMKALEDENRRLKRIVADQALDIDVGVAPFSTGHVA